MPQKRQSEIRCEFRCVITQQCPSPLLPGMIPICPALALVLRMIHHVHAPHLQISLESDESDSGGAVCAKILMISCDINVQSASKRKSWHWILSEGLWLSKCVTHVWQSGKDLCKATLTCSSLVFILIVCVRENVKKKCVHLFFFICFFSSCVFHLVLFIGCFV